MTKYIINSIGLALLLFVVLLISPFNHVSAATYNLSGKVTDTVGTGLVNATIDVLEVNTNNVIETTFSNSIGNYSLDVEEGTYDIRVTPPSGSGLDTSNTTDYLINSNSVLDFTLVPPPVAVNGTITDYLGNPLEHSNVKFENMSTGTSVVLQTDSNGNYSVNLPIGNYRILIDGTTDNTPSTNIPEVWQVGASDIAISENTTINYSVLVKEVEVQVKDSNNIPVEGVRIKGSSANSHLTLDRQIAFGSSSYQDGILTDSNGVATLYLYETNVEDGNVALVITPPEGSIYTATFVNDISLTEDKTITVELALPVTVSGTITDYLGQPLENSVVTVNSLSNGSQYVATSDSNGQYSLDIPPDNYSILMDGNTTNTASTRIPEEWQIGSQNISIQENKIINHSVQVKKVDVHVQDSSDTPIEGARIQVGGPTNNSLTLDGQTAFGTSSYQNGILTNSLGNATLWLYPTNEADGGYNFTITPPEGSPYAITTLDNIEVLSDMSRVIIMENEGNQPVYALSGNVYVDMNQNGFQDEGENGYEGAVVTLDNNQTTTSDANGNYTFSNLSAGTYVETLTLPNGFVATTTNPVSVALADNTTQNFGIAPVPTNAPPVITSLTAPVTTIARNNSVTMNASFSDQNVADTHTATWNWGDGTTTTCPPDTASCTMTESNGSGTVTATHTYATANVYAVTLTVTDNANASDNEEFQYITVYDPNDGWATGDREYTSPQGSVIGNTTATGKTEFGFTARYVNGVLQPVGNKWASVSFDAGNVDFVASAYNSLVITGNKIVLRGTGSLNGVSGYSVLISALDNGNQGTSYIRYQIKNNGGTVVYDTQLGAADTANPTTPLTKGKIQIH